MKKKADKYNWDGEDFEILDELEEGGPGSGNFGHAGRPGEVGGSAPAGHHAIPIEINIAYPPPDMETPEGMTVRVGMALAKLPPQDTTYASKITIVDPATIDKATGAPPGTYAFKVGGLYREKENDIFINVAGGVHPDAIRHEVGHSVYYRNPSIKPNFWAFWAEGGKKTLKFPTQYSKKNPAELFAESYMIYHAGGDRRQKLDPKIRGWFDDYYYKQHLAATKKESLAEGGPGSGHWGHAGRPGEVGGSAPAGAGMGPEAPAGMSLKYAFTMRVKQSWYATPQKQKLYDNKVKKIIGGLPKGDSDGLTKVTMCDPETIDAALHAKPGTYSKSAAAVYDSVTNEIFVNLPFFGAVNVAHEVGHHVWYTQFYSDLYKEWAALSTKVHATSTVVGGKVKIGPAPIKAPSYYAKKNKEELFAESYAHYHATPATRANLDPKLRAWFDKYYADRGITLKHDEQLREYVAERAHTEFYRKVGNFEVWLVDGDYVRAGIDQDFGSFGQPERFEFIPKNEMWIDGRDRPEDYAFFIDHLVLEQRLMARKLGYQEALEASERLARAERKRAGRLHVRGQIRPVSEDVYVEELTEEGDCRVVLVDGAKVRKFYDSDFSGSGNDYVYASFIPSGEVWIDDQELTEDIDFRIIHELWERSLLAEGKSYGEAHREALAVEEDARIRINDRDWWLKQAIQRNLLEGGPGSGYFGHAGRPGMVGGSAPPDAATMLPDKNAVDKIPGRVTVLGKRVRPEDELNPRKKFAYEEVVKDLRKVPAKDVMGVKRINVVTRQTIVNMKRNINPYLTEEQAAVAGMFRPGNRVVYVQEDYVTPTGTTVLHEVAHGVETRVFGYSRLSDVGAPNDPVPTTGGIVYALHKMKEKWNSLYFEGMHYPTQYSRTDQSEFFAECYSRFWKSQSARATLSKPVQDWFHMFYKIRKLPTDLKESLDEGGKGSGNFGHAGRPGEVGGSAPGPGEPRPNDFGQFERNTPESKEADVFGLTLNTHSEAKKHLVAGADSELAVAVDEYSGDAYKVINQYLRTGGIDEDEISLIGWDEHDSEERINQVISDIDELMSNTIPRDITVYRGSVSMKRMKLKEGDVFEDSAYTSTTLNRRIADDFTAGDEYMFRIHVPKGTHGIYLGGIARLAEWELLLARNTRFRVTSINKNLVDLEVVPFETKRTVKIAYDKDEAKKKPSPKFAWAFDDVKLERAVEEGGPGSGFFGHAGRPGEVGGSSSLHFKPVSNAKKVEGALAKKWPTYAGHFISPTEHKRLEEGVPEKVANRWMRGNDPEWDAEVEVNPLAVLGPKSIDKPKGVSIDNQPNRQGRCYELACQFVMDNDDWMLVHATLYPRTGPFEDYPYFHAFAVKGETVYDAVMNKFYAKKDYYRYFTPSDERVYDNIQMSKLMLKNKTYGSWE